MKKKTTPKSTSRPKFPPVKKDVDHSTATPEEGKPSDRRYQDLFEGNPQPMWVFDQHTYAFLAVNEAAIKHYGYSREEFLSMKIQDIRPPGDVASLRLAVDSSEPYPRQAGCWRHRRKDGSLIDVEILVHRTIFSGREARLVLAMDVTERHKAEKLIHKSETQFRLVWETSADGMRLTDAEGTIIRVNEAYCRLAGKSREELEGRPFYVIFPEHKREEFLNRYRKQFADQSQRRQLEAEMELWNGKKIWVEASHSFFDAGLETPLRLSVFHDISDRKRSEHERQIIFDIIQGVNHTANLDELLHLIHQKLRQIIYAENCFVALYDKERDVFEYPFFVDQFDPPPDPENPGLTRSAYVFRTGLPILITADIFRRLQEEGEMDQYGTPCPAWLGVPLKTSTETIGVLVVQHYEDLHAYNQRDLEFLASVGNQVAIAIERKRAEDALRQSQERYQAFVRQSSEGIWRYELEEPLPVDLPEAEQVEHLYHSAYLAECNDVMAHMYGFTSAKDMVGARLEETLIRNDPTNQEYLRGFIRSGYRLTEAESVELIRTGARRFFLNNLVGIVENGKLIRAWGMQRDITRRKEAEEALRKSDERFHLVARATNDVVWDWDLVRDEIWWNEGLQTLFGYDSRNISAGSEWWVSHIHAEDRDRVSRKIQASIDARQDTWSDEYRFLRADGTYAYILDRGYLILGEDGKPVRMIGAMMDVSSRREAEERIERLNRLYAVLSRINEVIVRVREPDKLFQHACQIAVSEGALHMAWIGLTDPETLIVKPVAQAGHVDGYLDQIEVSAADIPTGRGPVGIAIRENRHCIMNDFQRDPRAVLWREVAAERGFASCAAFPLRIGDRTIGAIALYAQEVNYFDEEVVRLLDALAEDVSFALLSAEQENQHKEAEERYRRLVELSPDAIAIHSDGKFVFVNSSSLRLFGADSPDQLIGTPILDRVHPDYRDLVRRRVVKMFDERKGVPLVEEKFLRLDGTPVDVEVVAIPFTFHNKPSVQVVIRDITERKQAEEALYQSEAQLRQAQKMEAVGRLAGGVAHDFNNLLTAITGYSDLMLLRLPGGDPIRRHAEEIKKAADRAASLTQQLLAFSRKQVLQARVLDLSMVIKDMDEMIRRLIGEDIHLTLSCAPELGMIKADPGQIQQILMNLAVNARDAMPKGGQLTVEMANVEVDEMYADRRPGLKAGKYIMLAVSDTGSGMDEETQAHLFEPFFTTKEQGKGTGLGLSTVYGIVKQSGGYISVYSEISQGSTFKVYFPQYEETAESATRRPDHAVLTPGTETILLAEDEDGVRDLVRDILEMNGYKVLVARDGNDALHLSQRHQGDIHLLLTDVVMPQMSGRELSERLAPLRPTMKVIFMSGYTDDAIVRHGALEENMAFLQKPFTPSLLARKVREVLETWKSRA